MRKLPWARAVWPRFMRRFVRRSGPFTFVGRVPARLQRGARRRAILAEPRLGGRSVRVPASLEAACGGVAG
jgi:hypothetical protein